MKLTIAETTVRQDANGRFNLNDLHMAAGGNRRHGPWRWTRSETFTELVAELTPDLGFEPAVTVRGGKGPGTYVCEELVYAYAMWISPKFHIRVIRACKAQTGKDIRQTIGLLNQRLALESRDSTSLVRASFGSRLMLDRKQDLPGLKNERARLEAEMQQGLFGLLRTQKAFITTGTAA